MKKAKSIQFDLIDPGYLARVTLHSLFQQYLPSDPPGLSQLMECHSDDVTELSTTNPVTIWSHRGHLYLIAGYRSFTESLNKGKPVYGRIEDMSPAKASRLVAEELLMGALFCSATWPRWHSSQDKQGTLDLSTYLLLTSALGRNQDLAKVLQPEKLAALLRPEVIASIVGRSRSSIYSGLKRLARQAPKPKLTANRKRQSPASPRGHQQLAIFACE